jgi:hypothetical protein
MKAGKYHGYGLLNNKKGQQEYKGLFEEGKPLKRGDAPKDPRLKYPTVIHGIDMGPYDSEMEEKSFNSSITSVISSCLSENRKEGKTKGYRGMLVVKPGPAQDKIAGLPMKADYNMNRDKPKIEKTKKQVINDALRDDPRFRLPGQRDPNQESSPKKAGGGAKTVKAQTRRGSTVSKRTKKVSGARGGSVDKQLAKIEEADKVGKLPKGPAGKKDAANAGTKGPKAGGKSPEPKGILKKDDPKGKNQASPDGPVQKESISGFAAREGSGGGPQWLTFAKDPNDVPFFEKSPEECEVKIRDFYQVWPRAEVNEDPKAEPIPRLQTRDTTPGKERGDPIVHQRRTMHDPPVRGPSPIKRHPETEADPNWLIKKKDFWVPKPKPPPVKIKPDIRPPAEVIHRDYIAVNKKKMVEFQESILAQKLGAMIGGLSGFGGGDLASGKSKKSSGGPLAMLFRGGSDAKSKKSEKSMKA